MKPQDFMDLLKQVDETTEDRIAEEFPVNWGKEAQFEAVYRAYLQQTTGEEPPPAPITIAFHQSICRAVISAACLLLTVGLGFGVWARQQKIEPLPPQETQTATVVQTETTSQVTTESQTTGKQTAERAKEHETAVNALQTSDRVPPSESAAAPTAFQTETSAPQTNAAAGSTPQTTPPAKSTHTELPQTSVTDTMPVQAVPFTPQTSLTAGIATEPPRTDAIETTVQATTVPMQTPTHAYTQTGAPTEPPPVDYDVLPGFAVTEWDDGKTLRVEWLLPVTPSPESVVPYHLESDRFVLEFAGKISGQSEYWYDICDTDTEKRVRVRMEKRRIFTRILNGGGTLMPAEVSGHPGFWYLDAARNQCILCWDNGLYQCIIYAAPDEQEILLPAAEAMYPDTAES